MHATAPHTIRNRFAVLLPLSLLVSVFATRPAYADWQKVQAEPAGAFVLAAQLVVADPGQIDLKIRFCADQAESPAAYYLLSVQNRQVRLTRIDGEEATPLGRPGELPPLQKDQVADIALHRGQWRIAFICSGRVVLSAYDAHLHGPHVSYNAASGVQMDDAWVQAIEPPQFHDAFMRTVIEDKQQQVWDHLAGEWQLISLREDRQADEMSPERSSNSFSYYGTAEDTGLTAAGYWFWHDCTYSLAARSRGATQAFGLAFYVQDENNYLLLRWDNQLAEQRANPRLRLDLVTDGQANTLAEKPGGYLPHQWYQLRAEVCDGIVRCYVDDQLQLQAHTDAFGQGKIGLFVRGKEGAWFDDVTVRSADYMLEQFTDPVPGKWATVSGAWEIADNAAIPSGDGENLLMTGSPAWADYAFSARTTAHSSGSGLAIRTTGPENGYLFRYAPEATTASYAGKAQILRMTPEGPEVLAQQPLPPGLQSDLVVTAIADGRYLAGLLDGQKVVDVVVNEPTTGGVALYADAAGAAVFDRATVQPLPERQVARVTKEFADTKEHHEMAEWASTRHNWVQSPDDNSDNYWETKGDYYGPLQIAFELKGLNDLHGTMAISLGTHGAGSDAGRTLHIAAQKGSRKLTIRLTAGQDEIASGEITPDDDTAPIRIDVNGPHVTAIVNDVVVLKAECS